MTLLLDLILALVTLEAAALLLWRRRTGTGPHPILANLAAGAALLLALRLALAAAPHPLLLACLLTAGLAHLTDLRTRWH